MWGKKNVLSKERPFLMAESIDSVVDSFSIALEKNNKQNDCPATFHKLFLKLKKKNKCKQHEVITKSEVSNLSVLTYIHQSARVGELRNSFIMYGRIFGNKKTSGKISKWAFFLKSFLCSNTTLNSDSGTFNNIRCQQDCFTQYSLNKLEFPKQTLSQRSSLKGSG